MTGNGQLTIGAFRINDLLRNPHFGRLCSGLNELLINQEFEKFTFTHLKIYIKGSQNGLNFLQVNPGISAEPLNIGLKLKRKNP